MDDAEVTGMDALGKLFTKLTVDRLLRYHVNLKIRAAYIELERDCLSRLVSSANLGVSFLLNPLSFAP